MGATVFFSELESPLGPLLLSASEAGLTGVFMVRHKYGPERGPLWERDDARLAGARAQLEEYFAGARREFSLPLAPQGTPFQQRVWAELARIPFGVTVSYQELARRIGAPTASRAVGAANGRNPLSIIVPCHRVVGADGSLTGYGGGEERKRWLLAFEGCLPHGARQRSFGFGG
jgi:methylated-DNA-[protein]-cysteine S-methyltransferase